MSSASTKRGSTTLRRRSRRRSSGDQGRKAFIAAIDHLFVVAAPKVSSYIPSAEEFLAEVEILVASLRKQKTRSKTTTRGGASSATAPRRMDAFLQRILGAAVGTFDTPCNRVMSYISIALYAVMFHSFAEAAQEVSMLSPQLSCTEVLGEALAHPTYTQAIHTPTRWFFRRYFPALESNTNAFITNIQRQFDQMANKNTEVLNAYGMCRPSMVGSLAYSGLQAVFLTRSLSRIRLHVCCTGQA
jgi:hypothetical protein